VRLSFAVGLAVGVVIGGGTTGCVAIALSSSLSFATILSLTETLR